MHNKNNEMYIDRLNLSNIEDGDSDRNRIICNGSWLRLLVQGIQEYSTTHWLPLSVPIFITFPIPMYRMLVYFSRKSERLQHNCNGHLDKTTNGIMLLPIYIFGYIFGICHYSMLDTRNIEFGLCFCVLVWCGVYGFSNRPNWVLWC